MNSMQSDVQDFMRACDQEVPDRPTLPSKEVRDLRIELMKEELLGKSELVDSMLNGDLEGVADGLSDLLYVVLGTAAAYGMDAQKFFNEVHRSNMTKVVEGKVVRSETGKILKPDTYEPPKLGPILEHQILYGNNPTNLETHALRELQLIGEEDWVIRFYLKVIRQWQEFGHSGTSAPLTAAVLNKLFLFEPLTPITDDPEEWVEVGHNLWQNSRDSRCFSTDNGQTYYSVEDRLRTVYKTKEKNA